MQPEILKPCYMRSRRVPPSPFIVCAVVAVLFFGIIYAEDGMMGVITCSPILILFFGFILTAVLLGHKERNRKSADLASMTEGQHVWIDKEGLPFRVRIVKFESNEVLVCSDSGDMIHADPRSLKLRP